ncbi:hypothetical protein [Cryobacterium luteum]|uniref:Uncharacterized protein n=1 Tax=Cryobacterium luteum TaxID=1424661 RepID=A0A1H8F2X9_9MICO|nr:hypothetical protein [Cryobacterium luteum]TFB85493.1 hypothetical protein E3O10_15280 [Cryobacterium luteum]SEN26065.1 hypothetical protein SAMN05216281_105168 [Cryobacterium luteum]
MRQKGRTRFELILADHGPQLFFLRRVNEREADAYFNHPSRPEHLRQLSVFAESLTVPWEHGISTASLVPR